jgi:hypothetical protein
MKQFHDFSLSVTHYKTNKQTKGLCLPLHPQNPTKAKNARKGRIVSTPEVWDIGVLSLESVQSHLDFLFSPWASELHLSV